MVGCGWAVLSSPIKVSTSDLISAHDRGDFSTWYAGGIVAVVAILLALTAYAFHTAVAGRPLFKAGFLEPN